MDLRTAATELREQHGLDLEEEEAYRLLNEANRELCVRGEWTRRRVALTSGDPLPDDVHRIIRATVGGREAVQIDELTAAELDHTLLQVRTVYWIATDDDGRDRIYARPVLPVAALAVVAPPGLGPDDEFTPPADFHRACINYVRAVSYGGSEDHAELEAACSQAFESEVDRLRRLRLSRGGRGRVAMRVRGRTA